MDKNISYTINASLDINALNSFMGKVWKDHMWIDYNQVLSRSLSYITAHWGNEIIGFINIAWDGNKHAFLLDTSVDPNFRNKGIGKELVVKAISACKANSIEWIHVDYEEKYENFYRQCGFVQRTSASLLHLT
ncbi:GNAT family N-acetyltransferase [Myroides albus]|uniref:GNAT family N-acetyltransferase n=2 Tax=Myroides TaxID=76831 RepID=UPI002159646E|nr:GNAT family N-acetyltransferase [Myroides albus]UVD79385.1 GNAT family N-acetyltransferase [Myroides albus]